MEVIVPDPSNTYSAAESKSVGTLSPFQQKDGQRGLFVDRGVGSPRLVKSVSACSFLVDPKPDAQTKVWHELVSIFQWDSLKFKIFDVVVTLLTFKLLEFNASRCRSCCCSSGS